MEGQFVLQEPKLGQGVLRNRGFEKSGMKVWSLSEANPRETRSGSKYWEVQETEGSRNRDSSVHLTIGVQVHEMGISLSPKNYTIRKCTSTKPIKLQEK